MKILYTPISLAELSSMAEQTFGDMVKVVVDIDKGISQNNRSRGVDNPEIRKAIRAIVHRLVI